MKAALNSYKTILQQIPLNVRSLDKQDSVEIKEWSTKKLIAKQVQHKGIESSFHIIKTVLPHITQNKIFEAIQKKIVQNNEHKMAIFHFKTIHQILICGKILSKWESNVSQNCNLCNKEDDISHMLFTCIMVRNVWKDVSHILQCELKLEHIILYHNENYHSNIDNELINYCISEVAYSICKF